MKEFMVKELLDRYEKSIQEATYYKARVNRHEDDLRKANREAQQLRVNVHLLEAKIEELQKNEQ
jgi:multidrug resistance efflux pump